MHSILEHRIVKEELMSCPYFKEGYFGIYVAPGAIHVPSIEEMERFCFRSWYRICQNIASPKDSANSGRACTPHAS